MGIEKSPTYIALPEHAKLTPSYAQFEFFRLPGLWLLQLMKSLRVRTIVTSACKAEICSRASALFKEGFRRVKQELLY
jgi:hypothetical protein